MTFPKVPVFFYGSYMNPRVLAEVDIRPTRIEVARLDGYDLEIRPLANLVPSPGHCAYGVVVPVDQDDLRRLYQHAETVLGGRYHPYPVVVAVGDGDLRSALCYLSIDTPPAPADPAYVERLAAPAREHGFPREYLERIESFAQG